MLTARGLKYTYGEYLDALELSPIKLEYWSGEILAMAGGTPEHEALTASVIGLLDAMLPSGCRPFGSNMKVRIPGADVTLLPDASIACGKLQRDPGDRTSVLNPGLIVEVTSPSTEAFDRGAKLEQYERIKSVRAIWIISHASTRVTVIERHGRTWKTSERRAGDQLRLDAPPLTIDVEAIYSALDGL